MGKIFITCFLSIIFVNAIAQTSTSSSYHLSHLEADGDARNTAVHFSTEAYRYVHKLGNKKIDKWLRIKHFASHAIWSYPLEGRDTRRNTGTVALKEQLNYAGTCLDFIKDRKTQGHYIKKVENSSYYKLKRPDGRPPIAVILKCSRVVGNRDIDSENSVQVDIIYCPVKRYPAKDDEVCELRDQHTWQVSRPYSEKNKEELKAYVQGPPTR